VIVAVREIAEVPGLTVSDIRGFPRGRGRASPREAGIDLFDSFEMTKIECVVADDVAPGVIEAIARAAHTGNSGDGKIFVSEVQDAISIRTRKRGTEAL
jgi:nitrogen regulatory protein P-II 1